MKPVQFSCTEVVRRLGSSSLAILAGVLFCTLVWFSWPTLCELGHSWSHDPKYTHGYLVPLFAAYLLWVRRPISPEVSFAPSWAGSLVLAAGLALYLAGVYFFLPWINEVALLPMAAGFLVLLCGLPALRWAWPGIAFLAFMLPLPYRLELALAHPLQRIGTIASVYTLQTLGFTAHTEGNVIIMGQSRLNVVEACNGLGMLMIFFALTTAVVILVRRPWLDKAIILASAVPIALIGNIVRIVVTGVLYVKVGQRFGDVVFHDLAGWLMMPLALGLLWLELKAVDWVLVPRPQPVKPQLGDLLLAAHS